MRERAGSSPVARTNKELAYHSQIETWQKTLGYNSFYDLFFGTASYMLHKTLEFSSNNKDYILWLWKGDYLNLGAGAEVGIYFRPSTMSNDINFLDHYFTEIELSVPMTLYLYNQNDDSSFEHILSWEPEEEQWWITGFNPKTIGEAVVAKQVMVCSINLSEFGKDCDTNEVYKNFKESASSYDTEKEFLMFDDDNTTVWIIWFGESSI